MFIYGYTCLFMKIEKVENINVTKKLHFPYSPSSEPQRL